ncbi:hypothetical protein FB476_3272 [Ornithinimicrobium humiphilum]|uniref:LVIVD repeat-containing protein n=1 Tax=Ornithinimicrobium humiphilum TaxID=125288 RepID=A0A543K4L8_9MICO|nr:hypothetical protein [Ornithinimicrobium humiphilum]TQM90020.1 hypothetical protein FB476_3272 [Ornithinimicrobium humiphilum]
MAATFGLAMSPVVAVACTDHYKEEMAMAAARQAANASGAKVKAAKADNGKSNGKGNGKGNGHGNATPGASTLVTTPPTGASKNVEFIGQLPEAVGATAINFIDYPGKQKVMFVTGRFGLKSYDVSDPEHPLPLDSIDMPGFWQNEDMDVDPKRKLVFMARDPRAFGQNQATGESGVYIVDANKPHDLKVLSYTEVPAGHTTTCINDCEFLWSGGPRPADWQPSDWAGRPIFAVDIRNAKKPKVYGQPLDLGRNDGVTDYAHDVQIDEAGVAWVSGAGGIRGYWTKGRHWDPVANKYRVASATDPVPYAGGKFYQSNQQTWGGSLAHNMARPLEALGDYDAGQVALVTIENFTSSCATDGRLLIVDLADSENGQAWSSTEANPYRLPTIAEWTPDGKPGSLPGAGCSAHYFQYRDGVLAQSFYGQGTHFIDVSDPENPTQIAYYRADGGSHWAPYWVGDVMYIADGSRGVDIIRPTYATNG